MRRTVLLGVLAAMVLSLPAYSATIAWVSDGHDTNSDGIADDQGWVDLLQGAGYTVNRYDTTFQNANGGPDMAVLEDQADMVIVSRDTSSGSYNNLAWNEVRNPLMLMSAYLTRNTRWKWLNTSSMVDNGGTPTVNVGSGKFAIQDFYVYETLEGTTNNVSFNPGSTDPGNAVVIATAAESEIEGVEGAIVIAEWYEGVEFYDGSGEAPAGDRMLFVAGTREDGGLGYPYGAENLNVVGEAFFLNAVENMIPEPATMILLGLGGLTLVRRRK